MMAPDSDRTAKLWSLIKDIRVAMLTSEDGEALRSRPMAACQSGFGGTLWFFTRADSAKVQEIQANARVCVSYADPKAQNYVSVSGRGSLVRERATIDAQWGEEMRAWFPRGKEDPDLALLKVDVTGAEYWDAPSATMVYAYGYAKALLPGALPHPGEHEKLRFS